MRSSFLLSLVCALALSLPSACVDPLDLELNQHVNVVVVTGSITDRAEPQLIRLNRSKSDSLTGRFGTLPITKASVEVIVDSSQVFACHETDAGSYLLPSDFKGQIGHAYQLRFTLSDGTRYQSTQQIMLPVAPIDRVTSRFNPKAIFSGNGLYSPGHELYLDFKDPPSIRNYYRWEWKVYETQDWCRTCFEGLYAINTLEPILPFSYPFYYTYTNQPYEDCFTPPPGTPLYLSVYNHRYDYPCRTQCWEIIYSYDINVFSDQLTDGAVTLNKPLAPVPLYQASPCLVDIRQESLTREAYQYFNDYQQQTVNNSGLADTPPTALGGNVHNMANPKEVVIGFFTSSAVAVLPYYLDRKDVHDAQAPTLFYSLYGRYPLPETQPNFILNGPPRPPTAVCGPIDQRTPNKPDGWRD